MPAIGDGGATIFAVNKASHNFVDYIGDTAPLSYEFPDTTTPTQINTLFEEVGQGSNAVEWKRNVGGVQESIVIGAVEAPSFDEGFASVNNQAHMKWVASANPRLTFVLTIPAVDFSLLTTDRQQVNHVSGQGQTIYNAAVAALGAGWTYAGSWLTSHASRTKKPKRVPGAIEPETGMLPSGLPDEAPEEA